MEEDIWMQLPIWFQFDGQNEADYKMHYILKLNNNLYRLKQISYNCYDKLKKSLIERWLNPSDIDPCLYIGNVMIVLTYTGNCIIVEPSMIDIDGFIRSMKNVCDNFVLTNEGDIKNFGIEITQLDENIFKISQHFLIDRIISFLNTDKNNYGMDTNSKSTPVGKPLIHKDLSGKPRK